MAHYDEDHLTITYDPGLDGVEMDWHGFANGEAYREGLNEGLALANERGAENWLADLRDMESIPEDDQEWSNEEWFPRAIDSSLRNMAIVQPESVVANMSVDTIMEEVADGALTSHYFDDVDDAKSWLRERS
jgi:hypothetical protein